jgi:hypothetical protein
MAPFEALYGRKCRTPLNWVEAGERRYYGIDFVQEAEEQVRTIQKHMAAAQARQKSVTEPPNYTRLSRKIIQRKDNSTNLSSYNPVVREISTDFKLFHITARIVLSSAVTIISYINACGIKYIGV